MSDEVVVALSALEHFEYCPRQCALIHVDGVWVDNDHTERGHAGHQRVDTDKSRVERGRRVLRGIPLWSERLGLSGRADVVELYDDGAVVPVEYKIGGRHGKAADVQLCAQALCLEEMFCVAVTVGYLWLSKTRQKVEVALDEDLRKRTLEAIRAVRLQHVAPVLPAPVNDARCTHCQLLSHCLPTIVSDPTRVARYVVDEVMACN